MPTHNVEELFHQFMQDPEYIGKEELALAEAKQRVIQSMNNHKALSMAKMDSPVESLLEFLLLQKGEHDFISQRDGKFYVQSPQGNKVSNQELFQHLQEELMHLGGSGLQAEGADNKLYHSTLNPDGAVWQDVLDDPSAYFQRGLESGQHSDSHRLLDKLRPGMPGIEEDPTSDNPDAFRYEVPKGQDAINELEQRLSHLDKNHPTRQLFDKLKTSITGYNSIQGQLDNTKQVDLGGTPTNEYGDELAGDLNQENPETGFGETPLVPSEEVRQTHNLETTPQHTFRDLLDENHFVTEDQDGEVIDASRPSEGGEVSAYNHFKAALAEVVETREAISNVDSTRWPDRRGDSRGRIQAGVGKELSDSDSLIQTIQRYMEAKATTLSGGREFNTPHEALEYVQNVADNPSQFLPKDSPYQPIHTGDGADLDLAYIHNGYGKKEGEEGLVGGRLTNRKAGETNRTSKLTEIAETVQALSSPDGEHSEAFEEPERVGDKGSMNKIPFSPVQNEELKTIRHPDMDDSSAGVSFRTKLASAFERDQHTDHDALGQLIAHLKEEGNFDSDQLSGEDADSQMQDWFWNGEDETVTTDLRTDATSPRDMGMNQLVDYYLNGDMSLADFSQMAHLGASSGRFSDEEAKTLARFDVSLHGLNPKGEAFARSLDPGEQMSDEARADIYDEEADKGTDAFDPYPDRAGELVGEDIQGGAFDEAADAAEKARREEEEGFIEEPGEKFTATDDEKAIIDSFSDSSDVRSTDSPLVYLDHASTLDEDGNQKVDSSGNAVTPRWKLWDAPVPKLDKNGKISSEDQKAIQERFWTGKWNYDKTTGEQTTKLLPSPSKDPNLKNVQELADFQANMGHNIESARKYQSEQLGVPAAVPGQTRVRPKNRGNVYDHASLSEGDKFEDEHDIVLPNDESVKDYEQYRDVMAELVNAGVPLDMITHSPSKDQEGFGERMWTREAMIRGMQDLGVLNYGEGGRDIRTAIVQTLGGKREYQQGMAPVFPGAENVKNITTKTGRDAGVTPEKVLLTAKDHPARIRRESHAVTRGTEGSDEYKPGIEFSPEATRAIKAAWATAHPPELDRQGKPVMNTGVGNDSKVTGLKGRPKDKEPAPAPSTRTYSSPKNWKWLKRNGSETDSEGATIQDTGGGFKDSQYLDRLVKKAVDYKDRELSAYNQFEDAPGGLEAQDSFTSRYNKLVDDASQVLRRRNYEVHSDYALKHDGRDEDDPKKPHPTIEKGTVITDDEGNPVDDPTKKGVATGKFKESPYGSTRPGVVDADDNLIEENNELPEYIQSAIDSYNKANEGKIGFMPITERSLIPDPEKIDPSKIGRPADFNSPNGWKPGAEAAEGLTDDEIGESTRAFSLLNTILKTNFGTQTIEKKDEDGKPITVTVTSPSAHEGVNLKQSLNDSFNKFIDGRKTPVDWDAVHQWASSEGVSHYFPDGVPHVSEEFPDYNPSNAEEKEHEARNPGSRRRAEVIRDAQGSPVDRKRTDQQPPLGSPEPHIDALRDFINKHAGEDDDPARVKVTTGPTWTELQAHVESLKDSIKDVKALPPGVQELVDHVDAVSADTSPEDVIPKTVLDGLEEYIADSPLVGEIIPQRSIEGDVQQPQEGRVVEGTSRLINGDSDAEVEQPATDEQPSGEQDNPQKFVNTHQPNNLEDVKEWGDQITAAEEEKGRPLSDEEKADLRENIDGKGWINNPNYVEPEESPDDPFADDESDVQPGDENLDDDIFEPNPIDSAEADHASTTEQGWGGNDVDENHFEGENAEGEQKGPQGYAHEVKAYAKQAQEELGIPLIADGSEGSGVEGEPHDKIYDHHTLGNEDPVTLQHIKDYIESQGKTAPKADWEKDEEQPAEEEPEETTGGTTPPTTPTPPTAEAAEEPEDEEEDQEALEVEQKKAAKEEFEKDKKTVDDAQSRMDAGEVITEKENQEYRDALNGMHKHKEILDPVEASEAEAYVENHKKYMNYKPKSEEAEGPSAPPIDTEGGASKPPEVEEGEEPFDPTPKKSPSATGATPRDDINPNPSPYTIVDKDGNEVYTEGESGTLPMQAEDGEPYYRKYKNADGTTVIEQLLPPDTEEDREFDEREGIIRGVNMRGGYDTEEEKRKYAEAIDYMETMHSEKDADGVSDAEKYLSESRAKIARGHAENADRYLERLEGKTPTPTPTATPRPTPRARTDAEPRFKGGERRGGENLREGLTTDKLAEDHPGHPNNWPNFTTREKNAINDAGGPEAFLKALEHHVERGTSSDNIKAMLDLPERSGERLRQIKGYMSRYIREQDKNIYGEVDQKEIRSQIPSDLDPTASRREATEQLRNVVGQAHQLSLLGGTDKAAYTNHIQKLQKLADDAIKAGADDELIKKEALDHTKFPEAEEGDTTPTEERTDGILQPSFGSREHLADAQKYHDRVDSHTADYKSLFDAGSQKAVDAWADPHYNPNARAIQNANGSNSGKYEFHKYDHDKGETSVEQSHERDTNIPNRQNALSKDSVSTPPHVLGLTPEQQASYSNLHEAKSKFSSLPESPMKDDHAKVIQAAESSLGDSLNDSGHGDSILSHPHFGANSTDLQTGALSGDSSFEKSPEGHHFVPDVGHVNTAYINHIQSKLEPGDAFHHTGVATDDKRVSEAGQKSLVSNPDGTPSGKGVMVTKDGVHAVGSIMGEEHTHETHGPISNQHIRETDLANGLHVATGAATGEKHSNVTQHPDGFHIKNVSKTMTDSGSHFGTANPPSQEVTPSPTPASSAIKTAGTALSRLAAKTAGAIKPAADAAARAYTQGDNFKPEAVQEQTFGKVAKRGIASVLGKLPGTEGLSTKLTGMTPTESTAETESLQKLLNFVKSVK